MRNGSKKTTKSKQYRDLQDRVLTAAAKLARRHEFAEITITDIAKKAGVTAPFIHAKFGRKTEKAPPKAVIRRQIFERFLKAYTVPILTLADFQRSTPVDQLMGILRETLKALKGESRLFGEVVLQELLGKKDGEEAGLAEVFHALELIINEAERSGQFRPQFRIMEDWKIRHALFSLPYMLLRSEHLDEFRPSEKSRLVDEEIEIFVLGFLHFFCTDSARERVEQEIELRWEALKQRKSESSIPEPSGTS